ncbi:MAG TPA: hypothetical protein DCX67_12975 [Opitutae bacterium]|nr:hypothetical protein [Opitutae bacterium]|tara:strand:+ start:1622 stop:2851 length:1230 start_codon:yes stop_codon:yes gene_type:complete
MRKFILPPLLFLALFGFAWFLATLRPEPKEKKFVPKIPFVEYTEARLQELRASVQTHGLVRPRTKTTLLAETSGTIEAVAPFAKLRTDANRSGPAPSFRAGGFFRKNDLLLTIEDTDLKAALAVAKANLRRAELQLAQEREMAKQAKIEWGDRDWQKAPQLVRRIPQILKAEAETAAAEAGLLKAEQDLQRAKVRAPFEGRIIHTMADVGQRVDLGATSALAEVYALDSGEIDVSLSRSEIGFLGFSEEFSELDANAIEVEVVDESDRVILRGSLERSEGIVDSRTRLTKLVARVDDCFANPFNNRKTPQSETLNVGQFVSLRLVGQHISAFVVPDSAFRNRETILIIGEDGKLTTRKVQVAHRNGSEIWVSVGLSEGEKICTTPLEIVAEGMEVRTIDDPAESNGNTP